MRLKEVVVKLDDWLKNAGILGFYRMIKEAGLGKFVTLNENGLIFSETALHHFSEAYFGYFNKHYEKFFTVFVMIHFLPTLEKFEKNGLENMTKEELDGLNQKIKYFKEKLKSNSYKSACELMESDFKPDMREKELKEIKLKEKQKLLDKLEEIREQIHLLKDTIAILSSEEGKKYIGASNAMYNILNKALGGISFLNPQVKEKNMYKEMDAYFSLPALEYLKVEKGKYKYHCFSCGSQMDNLSTSYSMMNHIGFDINRKTSNVWNFNNDASICPICRLIYACVPAGFTYLGNRGIFVNYSHSIEGLEKINNRIREEIYGKELLQRSVFAGLVQGMQAEFHEDVKYELQDLQVIRYGNNKYTFNILSKVFLGVIKEVSKMNDIKDGKIVSDHFGNIKNASWKEGNDVFYLYEEVMDNLLNGRNQFLLIHKLIQYYLSGKSDCYFQMKSIYSVIVINDKFLKEVGVLEKEEKKPFNPLLKARELGYKLQLEYNKDVEEPSKGYHKKLNGIAYRMLNALKTNNTNSFMDSFINAHMYVTMPIPKLFSEFLHDEIEFKNLGYAFVTGMIGENYKKKEKTDSDEENENNKDDETLSEKE